MKFVRISVAVLSFFLILYTPYIVHGTKVDHIIDETEHITAPFGYNAAVTARESLAGNNRFTFSALLKWMFDTLSHALRENIGTILKMVAAGLISGVASHLYSKNNDIGTLSCVCIVSLMVISTFSFAVNTVIETIDTMLIFAQSFLPAVGASSAAAGQAGQAASCAVVFVAMQVFISLCKTFMLPLVSVTVVLSCADRLGAVSYLSGVLSFLKEAFKWCTGLLLIFYGAVIGLETQTAGTFDGLAGKTVKYAVGSFVPLVGGAISDSLDMVTVSARSIRSALGLSGIIGICCVAAGPLINVLSVSLAYKLAYCFCVPAAEKRVAGVIAEIGAGLTRVCGVLVSVCIMFFISFSMLCRFIGGGV